ncbi:ATP-dependent RNA helicase DHX33-like isoform X2 [Dysidea avara]|uniref:ATP-dependent RNA helicase DHX33-like isoform X2 n=1 Tax=Dysidea avara TaxID=196820 RepID=UPI00332C0343
MSSVELQTVRRALPIYAARRDLITECSQHHSLIVVGETGSGKTTQLPQYLLEAGLASHHHGNVACTQPRRVAAISLAKRVANERGVVLGQEVGYSVRFDDCSSHLTRLKYLTDGMLLREAIADPLLISYGTVILDEAHERTIHTDVLFGIVKAAQHTRKARNKKPLRIIVMSATLQADRFSCYFDYAKVLYIQGRQFPVQVYYSPEPQQDYLHAAIITVLQLHQQHKHQQGDILVFLTGQEEIESTERILVKCSHHLPTDCPKLIVRKLFAALPNSQQQKVFSPNPPGCRKVILSTNIAETSITLPMVKIVVDTGVVKAKGYNPLIGLDILCVQPISKAQARQRTGRAGREMSGECYRLYTEQAYSTLEEDTVPEIKRCDLSTVLLYMLALNINDVLNFDFMDPPSLESMVTALEQLHLLGAVHKTTQLELTDLGYQMSKFPLHPQLSASLLASQRLSCGEEILTIVSMLSVESVMFTPHNKRDQANSMRNKFTSLDGDHMMLLNIYKAYKVAKGNKEWCHDNYISKHNIVKVAAVRSQLKQICSQLNLSFKHSQDSDAIRLCLLHGFFMNVAEHVQDGHYRTLSTRQEVYIHPSSCLFPCRPHPHLVLYSDLVHTSKCYMRNVSIIEPNWLLEVAPNYFKQTQH